MAIYRYPKGISVVNEVFGDTAKLHNLPNMSFELFKWLQSYLLIAESPESMKLSLLQDWLYKNNSPATLRAHYAAARCYPRRLAEDDRRLTVYGEEVAELARTINRICIQNIPKQRPMLGFPLDIDEMVITAEFSWRAVGLLFLIHGAIEKSIEDYLEPLSPEDLPPMPIDHQSSGIIPTKDAKDTKDTKSSGISLKPDNSSFAEFNKRLEEVKPEKLEKLLETGYVELNESPFTAKRAEYTNRDFQVKVAMTTASQLIAYVPVTSLGTGRGRLDFKELARYGLIDVRTERTGKRGAGRQAFTVSDDGKKFMQELLNRDLLPPKPSTIM